MGQQQLLLIVLGVIIVGIAVVVGINVFTSSAASSNRDSLVSSLATIGSMAEQFYRRPIALGGGGYSFAGFAIPTSLLQTANMSTNATISTAGSATGISFTAVGTEIGNDGSTKTKVVLNVTPTGMMTSVTN